MKRTLLGLMVSTGWMWGQNPALLPQVSITGISGLSHGSVSVEYTYGVPQGGALATNMRARASFPGGSCSSGTGGSQLTYEGDYVDVQNRKKFPYDHPSNSMPIFDRAAFSGLTPGATYQLCVELTDGVNGWTSGAAGATTVTLLPLPAVHPVPPMPPQTFTSDYPYAALAGANVKPSSCASLVGDIQAAQDAQLTTATVLTLDPSLTCDGLTIQFHYAQDLISFGTANVDANSSTSDIVHDSITVPSYPQGIPPLVEGGQVRFATYNIYQSRVPYDLLEANGTAQNVPIQYRFYVHFPDPSGHPNTFQVFYPQPYSQCPTCLWPMGDTGIGNGQQFYEWPRVIKPIIIRTSTADGQFVPEHTRISKAWRPKMPTLRNYTIRSGAYAQSGDGNQEVAVGNIRFMGINFGFAPTGELSPNPVTIDCQANTACQHESVSLTETDGPFVFDRCIISGPDFPDRIDRWANLDAMGLAIKDSIIDQMVAWSPTSTWEGTNIPSGAPGVGVQTVSSHEFDIPPGEIHGGAFNYKSTTTQHIVINGASPTNTNVSNEGEVYVDSAGKLHTAFPQGVSGTSDIGVVETARPNNAVGGCSLTSQVGGFQPADAQGRISILPIACFYVRPDGTLDINGAAPKPAQVWLQNNGDFPEGSDTIIAGRNAGPVLLENNYIAGAGLTFHEDDCLNLNTTCTIDIGDLTVRRNHWYSNPAYSRASPNWDGNTRYHRQTFEMKHGQRVLMKGNLFEGPNACGTINNTGAGLTFKTSAGDSGDIDIESNLIAHGCGFTSFGTFYSSNGFNGALAHVQKRFRMANNVIYDLNGYKWGAYQGQASQGGFAAILQQNGAAEDVVFDHNTVLPYDGLIPQILNMEVGQLEGFQFTNSVVFYPRSHGAGGHGGINWGGNHGWGFDNADTLPACGSNNLVDKSMMDCAMTPSYQFAGNVIVPGYDSANIANVPCESAPNNLPSNAYDLICLTRATMTPSGQMSYSDLQASFGSLLTTNTLVNATTGVPNALAAMKFIDAVTGTNFRLRNESPFISGGSFNQTARQTTDLKDAGADINQLELDMGFVTLIGVPGNSVTSTAATVAFLAPDAQGCPVDYSSSDPTLINSFTRVTDTGTARNRAVALSGLSSGTTYYYRVNCMVSQPSGEFKTLSR